MKVLACYSIKGGVGKTSTAVNMAWFAADSGLKTLLIDLDPQAAASYCFRVKSKKKSWGGRFFKAYENLLAHIKGSDYDNLDVIPAQLSFRLFDVELSQLEKSRKRLRRILRGFQDQYDLVILDCPPTISLLSENVFACSDLVLVPVIPNHLSERPLYQLFDFFDDNGLPRKKLWPFFSMVQGQKRVHADSMRRMKKDLPQCLKNRIPFLSDVEKMGENRSPVAEYASHKPIYNHYNGLWNELRQKLKI
jgi:chromosome partitioning protein